LIVRLDTHEATDAPLAEIGGKAAGLARLISLGFPVPPAVVLPASEEVEDPGRLAGMVGGEPLAVRSSGAGEDTGERSAAGQFESVMGVTAETLPEAVERVRRSANSKRARAYGADPGGMAVVIQHEVASTRAGVAFSRDPLTREPEVVVECVFGHGEGLVSGVANPDRFRVDASDRVTARIAAKEGGARLLRTLRDDEVLDVAALARRAEEGFGHPVDVEFCFEGRKLWLVQCRAITGGGSG
jgi:rifampicin phosphotransferase